MTPVEAVRRVAEKIGWDLDDVDLFELNEAFSVQAVAVLNELGIPEEKVNVNGGAVALGHAIGSSGARVLTTLLYALKRRTRSAASRRSASAAATASRSPSNDDHGVEPFNVRRGVRRVRRTTNDPRALANVERNDVKTVGVVGAGTMGNGIAQVFAQAGFDVSLVDVAQPMLDRARRSVKSLAKFVEKGKLTAADRDAALARLSMMTSLDPLVKADYVVEAIVEDVDAKRALFTPRRRSRRSHAGLEHLVDLDHPARRRDEAAGQGPRHALHESRAADDARRADPRAGDLGRVDGDGVRISARARQDRGRSGRLSRLHREPHPDADDQRGDLRRHGGRRHAGGDRYRDEARDEPPDGAADARRSSSASTSAWRS